MKTFIWAASNKDCLYVPDNPYVCRFHMHNAGPIVSSCNSECLKLPGIRFIASRYFDIRGMHVYGMHVSTPKPKTDMVLNQNNLIN